jgi:hypothetical protein
MAGYTYCGVAHSGVGLPAHGVGLSALLLLAEDLLVADLDTKHEQTTTFR